MNRNGTLNELAGSYAGLKTDAARKRSIKADAAGLITDRSSIDQSIRVHERDDTPVEYIVIKQWFIRVMDYKQRLLEVADEINWHPPYMKMRYTDWVKPKLGLGYLTPALFRCAVSSMVLPRVRRDDLS